MIVCFVITNSLKFVQDASLRARREMSACCSLENAGIDIMLIVFRNKPNLTKIIFIVWLIRSSLLSQLQRFSKASETLWTETYISMMIVSFLLLQTNCLILSLWHLLLWLFLSIFENLHYDWWYSGKLYQRSWVWF